MCIPFATAWLGNLRLRDLQYPLCKIFVLSGCRRRPDFAASMLRSEIMLVMCSSEPATSIISSAKRRLPLLLDVAHDVLGGAVEQERAKWIA
eukprot:9483627-Pyramimonas_sp.AAC.2